jgi:hypothetical protein
MSLWHKILPNILFVILNLFVMLLRLFFPLLYGLQLLIHNIMRSSSINLLLKLIVCLYNLSHFFHFLRSLYLIQMFNIIVMFLAILVNLSPIERSVLLPMLLQILLVLLPFLLLNLLVLLLLNLMKPFVIFILFVVLGDFLLLNFGILLISLSQVFGH